MHKHLKMLVFIITSICYSNAFATHISIDPQINHPTDGDGGFAAVAEYGSDYVLVSLQGDYPIVNVSAQLDYYYNIPYQSNVNIAYSISGELTPLSFPFANIQAGAGIAIHDYSYHWYMDRWMSVLRDSDSINYNPQFNNGPEQYSLLDQQKNIYWNYYNSQLHISLYAYIHGYSRDTHEGPSSWYSGTLYVDPIVTVGGNIIDPIGGYYTTNRQVLNIGEEWQEDDNTPTPEPATMLLLGTGLVGVAGAARRRKKKQA